MLATPRGYGKYPYPQPAVFHETGEVVEVRAEHWLKPITKKVWYDEDEHPYVLWDNGMLPETLRPLSLQSGVLAIDWMGMDYEKLEV